MSVKEVIRLLKKAETISICYGGNCVNFDKDDALAMEAYGDFLVDEILSAGEEDHYEIVIAMRPLKVGCA